MLVYRQPPSAFIHPVGEEGSDPNQITTAFSAEFVWLLLNPILDGSGVISSHIA